MALFDVYKLYNKENVKVLSVIPMKTYNNVGGIKGTEFENKTFYFSDEELEEFKMKHELSD